MLFDGQRVLLELLDVLNEPVSSTDFEKLLFLYTGEGEPTPSYDFVPYRFGCFSFTSYARTPDPISMPLQHTVKLEVVSTAGRSFLLPDQQRWRFSPISRM